MSEQMIQLAQSEASTSLNNGDSKRMSRPKWKMFKRFLSFAGPGYLVAVGYMDPGNWATDLAAGSKYGYSLLSVVLIANLMAMLLQFLAGKLGIVTGMDLAQACRSHFSKTTNLLLWTAAEVAIIACELAEIIGAAIALQLLFGIPLLMGILITVADVLMILALQKKGLRYIEAFVIVLIATIGVCFILELWLAKPNVADVFGGYLPTTSIFHDPGMLYLAIGIIGATVMPHNLYLHSSIIKTRVNGKNIPGKASLIRMMTWDSCIALFLALLINSAILILASAAFHLNGNQNVAEIQDAYTLLTHVLGTTFASLLFGVALLAAGQNATLTGTIAGQVVMEGFLNLKLKPWVTRLLTRSIAIIPVVIITVLYGASGTSELLVFSQVILSLQLPFAVLPLVHFTSNRKLMGVHANSTLIRIVSIVCCVILVGLNLYLLVQWTL